MCHFSLWGVARPPNFELGYWPGFELDRSTRLYRGVLSGHLECTNHPSLLVEHNVAVVESADGHAVSLHSLMRGDVQSFGCWEILGTPQLEEVRVGLPVHGPN